MNAYDMVRTCSERAHEAGYYEEGTFLNTMSDADWLRKKTSEPLIPEEPMGYDMKDILPILDEEPDAAA